ncbi:hypothetical protein AB4Z48_03375 [Cupriavidus sp. 2TAF22]|uniref:hypothetical protein n=1 Tax=unclassified Cupriavidus TaxID=2640874 RepID=UPI003F92100B
MPFNQTQIESIIRKYDENKASLGRYPVPTPETIKVIDAVMQLVAPLDLIDGKADIADELGHIAMAVMHMQTPKIQYAFVVAFSGGRLSKPNFDKIQAVLKPAPLVAALNMPLVPADQLAFQFVYHMPPPDIATWPCAEPKALLVAENLDATLLGFACRWYTCSQLATPHRLDISFVSTREAFMLPCEACFNLFGDAARWPHVHL